MATGFNAQTDAADVTTAAKTKGIDSATQAFQKELDEIKTADPTSTDKSSYYSALNSELEKSGLLPEMAANWAKENYKKLDVDGNGISLSEISIELSNTDKGTKEHAFLLSLKNNYQSMSEQDKKDGGKNDKGDKINAAGISEKDLNKYIDAKGGDRANMDLAAILTDNKNYLFNALDIADKGAGGRDGKVSRSDIETFVNDLDTDDDGTVSDQELNSQALQGVEKEDRRKVVDLLKKYSDDDYWHSDSAEKIQKDGRITMDSLAKGLEFKTTEDVNLGLVGTAKDLILGPFGKGPDKTKQVGDQARMLEAVKELTGDDPTQSNEDQARALSDKDLQDRLAREREAATAKANEGTTPLADYDKEMIELVLTANKDVVTNAGLMDSEGVISKQNLDAFWMGLEENPNAAAGFDSDTMQALSMLSQSWKTVSKDGKTLNINDLSPKDFTGSGSGSGSEGPGETENPDESESYVVQSGDSFWGIAQSVLGEGASNADIQAYMQQIAELNKMDLQTIIYRNDKLKLPKRPGAE